MDVGLSRPTAGLAVHSDMGQGQASRGDNMICSEGLWESCWLGASTRMDDEGQDMRALALRFIDILLAL